MNRGTTVPVHGDTICAHKSTACEKRGTKSKFGFRTLKPSSTRTTQGPPVASSHRPRGGEAGSLATISTVNAEPHSHSRRCQARCGFEGCLAVQETLFGKRCMPEAGMLFKNRRNIECPAIPLSIRPLPGIADMPGVHLAGGPLAWPPSLAQKPQSGLDALQHCLDHLPVVG